MTNTFDFQVVQVSSSHKRALLKAGVAPGQVRSELLGYRNYRNGARFPRHGYVASVGYFGPMDVNGPADCAAAWRAKGLNTAIKYIPVD